MSPTRDDAETERGHGRKHDGGTAVARRQKNNGANVGTSETTKYSSLARETNRATRGGALLRLKSERCPASGQTAKKMHRQTMYSRPVCITFRHLVLQQPAPWLHLDVTPVHREASRLSRSCLEPTSHVGRLGPLAGGSLRLRLFAVAHRCLTSQSRGGGYDGVSLFAVFLVSAVDCPTLTWAVMGCILLESM